MDSNAQIQTYKKETLHKETPPPSPPPPYPFPPPPPTPLAIKNWSLNFCTFLSSDSRRNSITFTLFYKLFYKQQLLG